ncbi:MAG: Ferrichrome-iron receptor [Pseudomonadota bacterium]
MAYMPKKNQIAGACALLLLISSQSQAQTETELSPVVVTGEKGTGYVAKGAMIAGPGGTEEVALKDIPASVTVISKDVLDDRQARVMSEAAKLDASIGDYYAAMGYYENLYIRGFPLDAATSYRINGMSVTGEQNIPFENKERLEILKGVGAMQAGAASPGGLINYVTKRPKDVQSFTVGTGERGTQYIAADYGTFLGTSKSLGIRINAANENIRPYVKDAKGERQFFSLAADAKISQKTKVQFDFEYQDKSQKSVPGLMLLGGTTLPSVKADINLSHYSWVLPTEIKSKNIGLRLDHEINNSLKLFANANRSEVKINDRLAYPYGCSVDSSGAGGTFCSGGQFDVYDFRSDGEVRRNDHFQTGLTGKNSIGEIKHQWTLGVSELKRSVYKGASVYGTGGTPAYNGQDNIYSLNVNINPSTGTTGTVYKILDHTQSSLFAHDQISLTDKAKLFLGHRIVDMKQTAYDVYTGNQYSSLNKTWHLPQIGASYSLTPQITNYVSYSKGVEPGTIALPDSFRNSQVMSPKRTEQVEVGSKYAINADSLFSFAIFQSERPNEYAKDYGQDGDGYYRSTLVQDGKVTNTGAEATLAYKATNRLNLLSSAMYLEAKQSGASISSQNGQQAIGIPHWKAVLFADYLLPQVESLSVQGGWTYISSKGVTLDNSIKAPGYHKFDAGLKYIDRLGSSQATYRLNVENIFDKFYWRDVSQTYGSNTLYPGSPRVFRATATFDF